jgi:putative aldouronate transport system substrate-binding protein
MKKFKKVLSILLICMLVASLSVGCGKQGKDSSSDATTDGSNKDVTDSKDNASVDGKITDKPVKLTYWSVMSEYVTASAATLAETELYKELKNRTGVEIEFLHPPVGQDKEQFNLMIASDELPDLIEYKWLEYPGGPEKALEDGVIVELNDLIDKNAPNLKKY